jgi:hypothetical protein
VETAFKVNISEGELKKLAWTISLSLLEDVLLQELKPHSIVDVGAFHGNLLWKCCCIATGTFRIVLLRWLSIFATCGRLTHCLSMNGREQFSNFFY